MAVWNKWLLHDGRRWRVDEKKKALLLARQLCRMYAMAANSLTEAKKIASIKTCTAVVTLAGVRPEDRAPASSNGTPIPGCSTRRAALSTSARARCAPTGRTIT